MELHKIFMILLLWYVAQSKTLALFPILCNIPYLSDLQKIQLQNEFKKPKKLRKS